VHAQYKDCSSDYRSVFLAVTIVQKFLVMLAGFVMAVSARCAPLRLAIGCHPAPFVRDACVHAVAAGRNVPELFNETQPIAMSFLLLAVVAFIVLPLSLILLDTPATIYGVRTHARAARPPSVPSTRGRS
jgi:hypothetical protein